MKILPPILVFGIACIFLIAAILSKSKKYRTMRIVLLSACSFILFFLSIPRILFSLPHVFYPYPHSLPENPEIQKHWAIHADKIKELNDILLPYWKTEKNDSIVFWETKPAISSYDSRLRIDSEYEPEHAVAISVEDMRKIQNLMKTAGIVQFLINPDGARYTPWKIPPGKGYLDEIDRGYFYYDGNLWAQKFHTKALDSKQQINKLDPTFTFLIYPWTFTRIEKDWYIYTYNYD
jgi:hypothetical protein